MLLTQWMASALFSLVAATSPLAHPVCDVPVPPALPAAAILQTAAPEPDESVDRRDAPRPEVRQAIRWPGYILDVF